jgi:hypothetical protein
MKSKAIEIKTEKIPHYEGLALYVNGKKCHNGVFVNLQSLREFWRVNRKMLVAGWIHTWTGFVKPSN